MKSFLPSIILALIASPLQADLSWEKSSAELGETTRGIDAADLDGDGKLDIVAIGFTQVFAVLDPLGQATVESIYDTVGGNLLHGSGGDIDGDGDIDFVIARGESPWIEYRERRANNETAKEPKGVPDFSIAWIENTGRIEKNAKVHIIDYDLHGCHGLAIDDLNGDGRLDIVGNSIKGFYKDSLAWFENLQGKFVRHMIIEKGAPVRPHYIDTHDFNSDGLIDVVAGHSGGNSLAWYQSPSTLQGRWITQPIAEVKGVTNAHVADVNGDKRMDVIASNGHGTGVYWYRGGNWKQYPIDEDLKNCHSLAVGDFDQDGDMDVATASFSEKIVRWYENNGKGVFEPHDIDTGTGQEAYDLKAVDLNKDGRLDLLLAGRNTNNAAWYINR
ncbi:MAG: hypothetical protein ACI92G_001759 [Candidatus Pelagisphaera sp.]|jgi:hypothetical protein